MRRSWMRTRLRRALLEAVVVGEAVDDDAPVAVVGEVSSSLCASESEGALGGVTSTADATTTADWDSWAAAFCRRAA